MITTPETQKVYLEVANMLENDASKHIFRHRTSEPVDVTDLIELDVIDIYNSGVGTVNVILNGHPNLVTNPTTDEYNEIFLYFIEVLDTKTNEFVRQIPLGWTPDEAIEKGILKEGDIVRVVDINGNLLDTIPLNDVSDPLGLFYIGANPIDFMMALDSEIDDYDTIDGIDGCDHDHDSDEEYDGGDYDIELVPLTQLLAYSVQYRDTMITAANLKEVKEFLQ